MVKQMQYSASDIHVLEGLEPVRKRPGMYIGGTDQNALHHMVTEILDNSMDEAVAGFATYIKIMVTESRIVIIDNGRGIPVDPHPKYPEKSALEVIMTTLHSGGKFNTNVYSTSGGLHGVGVSVVNALSSEFIVRVIREGKEYEQRYAKGLVQTTLAVTKENVRGSGTTIEFVPDEEIFGDLKFDPKVIYSLARSKAYLYKGVKIHWRYEQGEEVDKNIPCAEEIHFPNGLHDFISSFVEGEQKIGEEIIDLRGTFGVAGKVECAFTWLEDAEGFSRFYCNTIHNALGGTHEQGFKATLLKSFRNYAKIINLKSFEKVIAEDVMANLVVVVSVFMPHPSFQGQTKDKLLSKEAVKLVENSLGDHLDNWLINHAGDGKIVLEHILQNSYERLRRKVTKDADRKNPLKHLRLPGKLTDCYAKSIEETELFIVEGESAGGTAKQARDRQFQAIWPLKGKILNVASSSMDKVLSNQEVSDLIIALGCGSGSTFDINKLRYGKVIIMTDADVDGAHICSLLLTFFYLQMRDIIAAGRLYLARPPLYRVIIGDKQHYVHSDDEKDALIKKSHKSKVEVSRFKGLGEMTAKQLKETTMSRQSRVLFKVEAVGDGNDSVLEFVNNLMGKKPEFRFKFIQENANLI